MPETPSAQDDPIPVRRAREQARVLAAASDLRDVAKRLEPFTLGEYERIEDTTGLYKTCEDPEFPTYHQQASEGFYAALVSTDLDRIARGLRDAGLVKLLREFGKADEVLGLLCEALASIDEGQAHADVTRWFHDPGANQWIDPERLIGPLCRLAEFCDETRHRGRAAVAQKRSAGGAFERDRRRLRDLFTEIQARLEEPQDDRIFPPIAQLVHTINNLELVQRLGLGEAPLFFTRRQTSENTTLHSCMWNDPTGAGGGEVLVMHTMRVNGETHDMMTPEYHAGERRALARIVERWVRAVDHLEQPDPYPSRPSFLPADWDQDLARDPLWRTLQRGIWDLANSATIRSGAWSMETDTVWVHKINAIVAYDKICKRPVFSTLIVRGGKQDALQVSHPEGGEQLCLRFKAGGTLDDVALAQLSERLSLWLKWRAASLKELAAPDPPDLGHEGPRRDTKHPRRKVGPPTVYDPIKDAKLLDDFKAAKHTGTRTYAEFENARGIPLGSVVQAKDRAKARAAAERRKHDRS